MARTRFRLASVSLNAAVPGLFAAAAAICLASGCDELKRHFSDGPEVAGSTGGDASGGEERRTGKAVSPGGSSRGDEHRIVFASEDGTIKAYKPEPMKGVYKFVDDQGVVNYVDDISKVPPKYRKKAYHPVGGSYTIYHSTSVEKLVDKFKIDRKDYERPVKKRQRTNGKVLLYSTPWCPWCKRAASYLRKRGVDFEEIDVSRSPAALKEMLRKTGGAAGVPVVDISGTVVRGFDRAAIDRALAAR